MALYYNSTNIPPGNHVYINNADCQKVIYNNVEMWKRSFYIFQNGPTSISGNWASYNMMYTHNSFSVGTTLKFPGTYIDNSSYGCLTLSTNLIDLSGLSGISFYLGGGGDVAFRCKDQNTVAWHAKLQLVLANV